MRLEEIDMAFDDFERGDRAKEIIEGLRKKAANEFGITVVDPYVTVRWRIGKRLVQVSMLVVSITDSSWVKQIDEENK